MHDEGSDTLSAKYAKLEPKSSIDAQLAMSKVHISKNWKLPPRLKPGRRPGMKYERSKTNIINAESPQKDEDYSESEDSQVRKKRQNRDAQRAYRERRASRLEQLESTVETLQNMVRTWQKRCKSYEIELGQTKKNISKVEEENSVLKRRLKDFEGVSVSTSCQKNLLISKNLESQIEKEVDTVTLLLDPFLQNVVSNFKPMKAVTLKKRKLSSGPHGPDLELSPAASLSFNRFSSLSPTTPTSSSTSGKCGFCSDSSTCVCKELEDENSKAAKPVRCSEDTLNCTKCSNIEESCIKPPLPPVVKGGNWKPGSCRQCKPDPQGKAFCKIIFSSASPTSSANGSGDDDIDCSCESSKSFHEEPICFNTTELSSPSGWKDDKSYLAGAGSDSMPNTTDPNFNPGSCANCQVDPQRKAFCQAIFAPRNENSLERKDRTLDANDSVESHHQNPDNGTDKPFSCGCRSKSSNCESANPTAVDLMNNVTLDAPKNKEFIPISDAYQRVRKYMQIRNANQGKIENVTIPSPSSLPLPMEMIASGLRVRGKEVELRSIDDAIRDMDKNALG